MRCREKEKGDEAEAEVEGNCELEEEEAGNLGEEVECGKVHLSREAEAGRRGSGSCCERVLQEGESARTIQQAQPKEEERGGASSVAVVEESVVDGSE